MFYVDGTGQHGLVAATADQSSVAYWDYPPNQDVPNTDSSFGMGSSNTTKIIAVQGPAMSYAARLCRDYTGGGHNDWFLPSVAEMRMLLQRRAVVGGLTSAYYWCSYQQDLNYAYMLSYSDYVATTDLKSHAHSIRAIRVF